MIANTHTKSSSRLFFLSNRPRKVITSSHTPFLRTCMQTPNSGCPTIPTACEFDIKAGKVFAHSHREIGPSPFSNKKINPVQVYVIPLQSARWWVISFFQPFFTPFYYLTGLRIALEIIMASKTPPIKSLHVHVCIRLQWVTRTCQVWTGQSKPKCSEFWFFIVTMEIQTLFPIFKEPCTNPSLHKDCLKVI